MKKVAFITGGGGYIGGETAITLAREGIKVAVCDINDESVKRTVEKIRAMGGEAIGMIADVTDSADIENAIKKAAAELGGLDIMVHVAGGSARVAGPDAKYHNLAEQEDYVIDRVLKINLYGAIWASRAAARIMIKQGRGGKIINFSSTVGVNGLGGCTEYAAAKGGVMSLTKSLAKELGQYKINVNSVAPGIVMRPEAVAESGDSTAYKTNFLGERCYGSDIAELVAFLASDKARFITGQTYICDGGRSLAMKGSD